MHPYDQSGPYLSSRMNADDRLPRASFDRVEGGDGIVEGGDGADVRAQPSVPHSLNDLAQFAHTISRASVHR